MLIFLATFDAPGSYTPNYLGCKVDFSSYSVGELSIGDTVRCKSIGPLLIFRYLKMGLSFCDETRTRNKDECTELIDNNNSQKCKEK